MSLTPKDYVGNEYFVSVNTDQGELNRIIIAFDKEDALDQIKEYCHAELLSILNTAIV